MVWFSEDVLSTEMIFENYILRLRNIPLEEGEDESFGKKSESKDDMLSPTLQVQTDVVNLLQPYLAPDGLVVKCLEYAMEQEHIMDFTRLRALSSLFSMLNQCVR